MGKLQRQTCVKLYWEISHFLLTALTRVGAQNAVHRSSSRFLLPPPSVQFINQLATVRYDWWYLNRILSVSLPLLSQIVVVVNCQEHQRVRQVRWVQSDARFLRNRSISGSELASSPPPSVVVAVGRCRSWEWLKLTGVWFTPQRR